MITRKYILLFGRDGVENMQNKKGLLILFAIVAIVVVGLKFNLFPSSGGGSLYEKRTADDSDILPQHKDGVEKTYYANGKIHTETPYKNGARNGVVVTYYTNGAVKSEAQYVDNEQNGETKVYTKDGHLDKIYTYLNNQLNGEAKAYDENERLLSKAEFKNNIQVGREFGYYPNGQVRYTIEFDDKGVINGKVTEY